MANGNQDTLAIELFDLKVYIYTKRLALESL